jgi:hypothetical protein
MSKKTEVMQIEEAIKEFDGAEKEPVVAADPVVDVEARTPLAELMYEAYRQRKQQNTALPQPAFHQLDELERASWVEAAKVVP